MTIVKYLIIKKGAILPTSSAFTIITSTRTDGRVPARGRNADTHTLDPELKEQRSLSGPHHHPEATSTPVNSDQSLLGPCSPMESDPGSFPEPPHSPKANSPPITQTPAEPVPVTTPTFLPLEPIHSDEYNGPRFRMSLDEGVVNGNNGTIHHIRSEGHEYLILGIKRKSHFNTPVTSIDNFCSIRLVNITSPSWDRYWQRWTKYRKDHNSAETGIFLHLTQNALQDE